MAMRTFRNALLAALLVLLPLVFVGVRRMENGGEFDSIGTWYTVYTATAIALPVAALFAAVVTIMLSQWRPRR